MIIASSQLVANPLVSVVIATYNQLQFIEETVMSALNQVCDFPFEVIVADDGSNDGQRDFLKTLQEKYPSQLRLIFNDVNLRVTKNYVNAIHQARGKYVATLDGDDIWIAKEKLQKQVEVLEKNEEVSIVYTGYERFDMNTNRVSQVINEWDTPCLRVKGKESAAVFVNNNYAYPLGSSACFRRDIYIKGCLDYPELIAKDSAGEGTILNIAMSMNGLFFFLNNPMVRYRVLAQSVSHFDTAAETLDFEFRCMDLLMKPARILNISPAILVQNLSKKNYKFSILNGEMNEYHRLMKKAYDNYKYPEMEKAYKLYCNPLSLLAGKALSFCFQLAKNIKQSFK